MKPGPEPIAPPATAEEVIEQLALAYDTLDHDVFDRLLANDPGHAAEFTFFLAGNPTGEASWRYAAETRVHRRMFTHHADPGEVEVPAEYWLQAVDISLTKVTDWAEPEGIYHSDTNPGGLVREKWTAVQARFSTHVFFDTQTDNDFLIGGEAIFTVIEDLEKTGAEPGRFLLLQWQEIDSDLPVVQMSEKKTWGGVKNLYR